MAQYEKLEDCKKEIRSILIPYQRGCFLSDFNRAYGELIGRKLPFREFGFSSNIDFLYSMPDVVRITSRGGDYHLLAVADEKSKHIQKMVARQKPSKSRGSSRIKPSRSYVMPPRFSYYGYRDAEPMSREIRRFPEPKRYNSAEIQPTEDLKPPSKTVQKETKSLSKTSLKQEPKLPPKASPKEEVIALVQYFDNQLALDDLLFEYQRMYEKDLLLSKYGYSSLEDCLGDIPELDIKNINKCAFVVYRQESSNVFKENSKVQNISQFSDRTIHDNGEFSVNTSSKVPLFSSGNSSIQNDNEAIIPDSFRNKLKMVAEKFLEIRSSDFPSCFEESTGTDLDLYSIGYRCLNDLIDDVPDIFIREPVAGSQKDYIIYPADVYKLKSNGYPPLVQHVIVNIKKLLQAYPEGIQVQEFSNIYTLNFRDTLHVQDFGFEDLETFLISIKSQVPLTIDSSEGVKTILMQYNSDSDSSTKVPDTSHNEAIPSDAVIPDFKFAPQFFPSDFDISQYIPVYTSSVAHPGHLYIQLQGKETSDVLIKMAGEIETFYNGKKSERYMMRSIHVKVGASCIAKWPVDNHWYRAEIITIPSMETVLVHYVDYGTRDTISKNLLRYIKKEFVDLPAQAIKCRLAFLRPAKNATKWDVKSTNLILKLCEDVSLMAKVEEIGADGVYSILLCDTNGEEDVYINDVLCDKGLADYAVGDAHSNSPVDSTPPAAVDYHYNLNPLQALQAQYFLHAFVTVAPSFSQNENYLNLLRQVTMYCANPDVGNQNIVSMPRSNAYGPPGFNTLQSDVHTYTDSNALPIAHHISSPTAGVNQDIKYKLNISNSPVNVANPYIPAPTVPKSLAFSPEENTYVENDLFDDDDDEIFQQFCQQKLSSSKTRHVKKVILGDGYKIHVIVVESVPYASSGDISHLIWSNKEADYLIRRLQMKDVDIPTLRLSEECNEDLFQQLVRYSVKGVQKTTGCKASIVLYPLKMVIKILNIFGHPSVTLRTKLTEEVANFDPNDPDWMTFPSPNPQEPEDEDLSGATDDDKIDKLCLFDLYAMKESIVMRRKKMLNSLTSSVNTSKTEEVEKLEQLHQKVLQRIKEIKEICSVFA